MEISRKSYSKIIWILKTWGVSAEISIWLANSICELLENQEDSIHNRVKEDAKIDWEPVVNKQFTTKPLVTEDAEVQSWEKRKLIPWQKMQWWYVDKNWRFVPTFLDRWTFSAEEEAIFKELNGG